MEEIIDILYRYFTVGITEKEEENLEQWRTKSSENQALFMKMESNDFWKDAIDKKHKKEVEYEWRMLKKRISRNTIKRRLFRYSQWAAVILIPLFVTIIYFVISENRPDREELVTNCIPKNINTDVIITLADGEKVIINKDTIISKEFDSGVLKSNKDTISFISKLENIKSEPIEQKINNKNRIEIPRGAEYFVTLEDGTKIHLDAFSTLVFPEKFSQNKREVELYGHGYFEVAHDSDRPFIVRAGNMRVKVLGTEFDFRSYKDEPKQTVLVSGKVEISNYCERYEMRPNQRVVIDDEGDMKIDKVNVCPYIAWRFNRIMFINKDLESIMKSLRRWYNINYVFLSEELKTESFTIDIEKYEGVDKVLDALEKTRKVRFVYRDNILYVNKKY